MLVILYSGIITIRAFGRQKKFLRRSLDLINDFNRPFYLLWASNRWLMWRIDLAGSFMSFVAGILIIFTTSADAGWAGLALSYAFSFNLMMLVITIVS